MRSYALIVALTVFITGTGRSEGLSIAGASPRTESPAAPGAMVVALPGPPPAPASPEPPPSPATPPPIPPAPVVPAAFREESSVYLQREIGRWTLAQARALLGEPTRQRPALGADKSIDGRIYAFSDPSGRYKTLELEFDRQSGALQTVFAYPPRMTWQECRHRWGTRVNATAAAQGSRFYSYLDRHLDVLVNRDGKVISLGLY